MLTLKEVYEQLMREKHFKDIIRIQYEMITEMNAWINENVPMTDERDDSYNEIFIEGMDRLCDKFFERKNLSSSCGGQFKSDMYDWKSIENMFEEEDEEL